MKFIWKIENFSDLECESLQSPTFSSHATGWKLVIYPNSTNCKDGNCICVELQQLENKDIALNCSFAFLDCKGSPFVWEDKRLLLVDFFQEGPGGLLPNVSACLIKRSDIFGSRKKEFLPNDILTVQCHIWKRTVEEISRPLLIFARSRVKYAKVIKTFDWKIAGASLFQKHRILEHTEPIMNGEILMLKMFLNEKNSLQVKFEVSMFKCQMEVQIFLIDSVKMIKSSYHKFNFTTKGQVCAVDTKISRNIGKSQQDLYLSNNILTLHFICSFSESVIFNRIIDQNEMSSISKPIVALNQISEVSVPADKAEINQLHLPNTIIQALQGLLEEGVLSDFEFRVGDRTFPVHKAILTARSQVFRAMFTSKMKEKEDNFVDIPDLDADTLQRLLQFVYSDKFDEDMGWERASSLYAAADKYALEPLKQGCSSVLKSGLSASNVLEVLPLADMHNDQDLKAATLDFISLNEKKVVCTELWKEFEEKNGKLALETFHKLFLKKMND